MAALPPGSPKNVDATAAGRPSRFDPSGELSYVGMLCLNIFLYLALAMLSLSFVNCVGKFSPVQLAAYRNEFLVGLVKGLGLDRASLGQLKAAGLVLIALLLADYAWAIYIFRRRPDKRLGVIMAVAAGASAALLLAPPMLSRDIFSNIFYGKIVAHYGTNPYIEGPQRFINDPAFTTISTYWKNTPIVYGPLYTLFAAGLAKLSGEGLVSSIYVNKAAMAFFHLGNVLLIWKLLGRFYPRRRLAGTLIYAWNPLVIIHSVGGGHNDVMMAFFAVLALYLALADHGRAAVFALTLSVLTKYVTAVLLAVLLLYLVRRHSGWRDRLKEAVVCGLIVLAVTALLFAPFWEGASTLQTTRENFKLTTPNSMGSLLSRLFSFVFCTVLRQPLERARSWGWSCARGLLSLAFLALFLRYALRCRSRGELLESWTMILAAFLLTTSYLYPWYMVWVIPFIAMREWDRRTRWMLALSTAFVFFNNDLNP
jgi:alpha-1,6-mannosyltransferase